jgi:hypothetical protein
MVKITIKKSRKLRKLDFSLSLVEKRQNLSATCGVLAARILRDKV